jgi:hypothetical protein
MLNSRSIAVLFSCALLLGYYDFALELAKTTWLKDNDAAESLRIEKLIHQLAALPPQNTHAEIQKLAQAVTEKPNAANIIVGSFIDRRRYICDYDDICNL